VQPRAKLKTVTIKDNVKPLLWYFGGHFGFWMISEKSTLYKIHLYLVPFFAKVFGTPMFHSTGSLLRSRQNMASSDHVKIELLIFRTKNR
jgi:hypothetical protein